LNSANLEYLQNMPEFTMVDPAGHQTALPPERSVSSNSSPTVMRRTNHEHRQYHILKLPTSVLLLCFCVLLQIVSLLSLPVSGEPNYDHHHVQHRRNSLVPSVSQQLVNNSSSSTHHSHHHHYQHRHQHRSRQHRSLALDATPVIYYQTANKSINFTHIEYDSVSGSVYLGAVNWIYQLGASDLQVERAVKTGPIRDSPACAPGDCSGVAESSLVTPTNNYNKVLLVEPYARMLIVCGSVHQGACSRHRLEDISIHEDLIPVPVASNDENSSTVAFIGPARYYGVQLTPILYVGATNSRVGPYRDMVPAIAGRSLESGPKLFNIIERSFADSARVDISSHLRDYFLVKYVYGFYAEEYVYFAQVQRKSYLRALEESGHVTRLSRVCVSDAGFHTYTELTLECVHDPSAGQSMYGKGQRSHYSHSHHRSSEHPVEEFNLLQDAVLIKAGPDLADALGIERNGPVLVGVFAASIDHTQKVGSRSAVCMFPLGAIERQFAANIHRCYNGSVYSRNMDYIAGSVNECPEPGVSSNSLSSSLTNQSTQMTSLHMCHMINPLLT